MNSQSNWADKSRKACETSSEGSFDKRYTSVTLSQFQIAATFIEKAEMTRRTARGMNRCNLRTDV